MPYRDKRHQAASSRASYLRNRESVIARKRERLKMQRFTEGLIVAMSHKYRIVATDEDWELYGRLVRAGLERSTWKQHEDQVRVALGMRARMGLSQRAPVELCVAVELLQTLKKEMNREPERTE